ncbi:hypothetical protein ABT131_21935 [Streptomyces sp900105245]|uniref:Uncharacterized protein n=1 Tax=Streptomyces albidocamelliae TaxID=2981135 RepID=A0ABY6F1N9_9ACTN|nr:hypothetical protein [Streptomyces sp. HUAS 14-6]UXY40376.1 hypothetical protein N8I86_38060 [Streptomyces sp. HUAS 14-6]
MTAPAPAVGRTGADRPGADPPRLVLQEITRGQSETLRRWLELEGDSTDEPLGIFGTADGRLREYTPANSSPNSSAQDHRAHHTTHPYCHHRRGSGPGVRPA